MALVQLDFFEQSEISVLKDRMDKCEASGHKVRKGTYAEIGAIKKLLNDLSLRLEIIERNICRPEIPDSS